MAPRADMSAAATTPMAAAAMGALASMAAQYGNRAPTPDAGHPPAPPVVSGAPTGAVVWDGQAGPLYSTANRNNTKQSDALGNLNTELGRILGGAVDNTVQGRAALAAIIAEADAALTALGPVADTAAGQRQVAVTLGDALQRAGSVLGQGQGAAAVSAEQVSKLASRYTRESRPAQPSRPRVSHPGRRGGGPPSARPTGEQGQWINEALRVLRQHGYDTSQISPADIAAIIQHESAGNPNAINNWDSNAAKGTPSKGLMQTIDPTFNAYSLPGHRDVWNPVDNIIAGVRYAISRYGSVSNVPGIVKMQEGGSYVGY
ncbi:DUF4226 domain-containing protein [Nocardia mexicana]|uniref:Uncharacterized protein DUF4226 n=1 Tax=Nocardia mexicana TaxID=279262 RepID=A0A370HDK1_9NOCA|nr:DUF4226 domain-containing protein [Nocardia mexicana]RDI54561.1 uncharacterized protein DUF4226 [Nocardia mexicana]